MDILIVSQVVLNIVASLAIIAAFVVFVVLAYALIKAVNAVRATANEISRESARAREWVMGVVQALGSLAKWRRRGKSDKK